MKRKLIVAAAAVAALVLTPGVEAGSNTDRATGGGQVLFSTDATGAGTTIAFTARGTEATATGEVQVIDRAGGRGRSSVRYHGTVVCLRVTGNTAEIGGVWERPAPGTFQIIVIDRGEGAAASDDIVELQNNTPNDCAEDNDDDQADVALARGNAQVHDATPPAE